jgi:hypothetical protein
MIDRELLRRLDGNVTTPKDGYKRTDLPGDPSTNGEISPEMEEPVLVLADEEGNLEMDEIIASEDEKEINEAEDTDEINVALDLDEIDREAFQRGRDEAELEVAEEKVKIRQEGFDAGFAKGKVEAESEAISSREKAEEEAFDTGFEHGYTKGRREGFREGRSKGRREGYREGYASGMSEGEDIWRNRPKMDDEDMAEIWQNSVDAHSATGAASSTGISSDAGGLLTTLEDEEIESIDPRVAFLCVLVAAAVVSGGD